LRKERLWRQRLQRWQRSGLTGRDFCRREHLQEGSFYSWKRVIAKRDRELAAPAAHTRKRRRASSVCPAPSPSTDFVPVRVLPTPILEVVVRTGQVVRVAAGFDAAHLRAVVAALEAKSC
jgi:hypothetical protein